MATTGNQDFPHVHSACTIDDEHAPHYLGRDAFNQHQRCGGITSDEISAHYERRAFRAMGY